MKKLIKILKENGIAIICFISIFFIAYMLHLFGMLESFQQFVVVIASAAATYIIVNISLATQSKHQLEMQEQLSLGQSKLQDELMQKQSFQEDKARRDFEIYNAKLEAYSEFVSEMYKALDNDHITSDELQDLRTKLFATVGFYAGDNVLKEIHTQMKFVFGNDNSINKSKNIDGKMASFFSIITGILQNDIKVVGKSKDENEKKENDSMIKEASDENNNSREKEDIVIVLWNKFQIIIEALKEQEELEKQERKKEEEKEKNMDQKEDKQDDKTTEKDDKENLQDNAEPPEQQYLDQQSWHFNAWGAQQFEQLKEWDKSKEYEMYDLSLVEYGEYWRTNLLKQVGKDDVIMLFRRGGYGYVGAFKPVGRRVFDFEKGEEEILYFDDRGRKTVKKDDEQFKKDVEKYDIYGSMEDGASLCSNLIVECIAYVPEGVGNPGGVYRRTISRYDSHYAWKLKKRFQEKGQWTEP